MSQTIEAAIDARAERAREEDVAGRIERRDGTLWAPEGTPEVTDRLGWLDIADRLRSETDGLRAFADEVRGDGYTDAVLLGMGGSSLAPEVLWRSFGPADGYLRLHVLDSTHPDQVEAVAGAIDLERTLFIVSSKSGGTIETLSQFEHFHSRQPDGGHFVAVTDPGTKLEDLAREHGFRRVFAGDPEIGGRYSALSMFGLVPAALIGADLDALLDGAIGADRDEALRLGCAMGELALAGRDKLTFVAEAPLSSFGLWVEHLIAESTVMVGRGIVPIAVVPLGDPASFGVDRVFAHIGGDALDMGEHPVFELPANGAADLGRLFFHFEYATAVAGWVLGINPFDQPNVQEAKDNTQRVLQEGSPDLDPGDLDALLDGIVPPRYVAFMAYLPYSDAVETGIARLRERLVREHGVATTFGYGPRFLHSTGQLHKGGPPTGAFVQIVDEPSTDVEIPGEPYTFATLIRAQADGDLQTLRSHGLDAVRAGKEIL